MSTTKTQPISVPDFRADTAAWKQYVEEQSELDALAKDAAERDQQMTADVRELQARYDEQLEAAVRGQGDPPKGERPERDVAVANVANIAHRRAADHRAEAGRVTAEVADDVVEAAKTWWADLAPKARAAIEEAQVYADALNAALRQVGSVRGAQDTAQAQRTGVRPVDGRAARTATGVDLGRLAAVVESGADPFQMRAAETPNGTTRTEGPGLRRWVEPAPSGKESTADAEPITDPVRAFL